MSDKLSVQIPDPKTQIPEAVASLAAFLGRPIQDGILDLGAVKLAASVKGDGYYTVTASACSCPAALWRPGQTCKHRRKLFEAKDAPTLMPEVCGAFKPFLEEVA